jgi:hypothetical protein
MIGISVFADSSTHVASYLGRCLTKGEGWAHDFQSKTASYANPWEMISGEG